MTILRSALAVSLLLAAAAPVAAQEGTCACTVPYTPTPDAVGEVADGLGQVEATDEVGALGQAGAGQPLFLGSRVITGPGASADITIFGTTEPPSDGCSIAMAANSSLDIFATNQEICVRVVESTTTVTTNSSGEVLVGGVVLGAGAGLVVVLAGDDDEPSGGETGMSP